ncbi:MAG: response regulator [Planctomycetes bacterium]|nr:response regulator [Planctomycetota bacterium]
MDQRSGIANILIVDDNQSVLDIVRALLARNGYVIHAALSAEQALETLNQHRIDVIVSDIMMPETDGYEFVRKLKDTPKWAEIPIIFLSALDSMEDQFEGFLTGAEAYLTKPFKASELVNHVARALAKREGEIPLVKKRGLALETARVLVLSNDKERREEIRRSLNTAGFQVDAARAEPASFGMLDGDHYHLLIAQIGVGGIEEEDILRFLASFQLEVALIVLHEHGQGISSAAREIAYGVFELPLEADILAHHARAAVGA